MAKTDPALIPGAATGELAHGSLRSILGEEGGVDAAVLDK
jgi:hypothetical protein